MHKIHDFFVKSLCYIYIYDAYGNLYDARHLVEPCASRLK